MSSSYIFLPVLANILLTVFLYIRLAKAKKQALANEEVDLERRALHVDAWPDDVVKINNNIKNQFEVPVLFYVVSFILWATESVSTAVLVLSWTFVGSRIIHTTIHIGTNFVPTRRKIFLFGSIIVLILTLMAIWSVLF